VTTLSFAEMLENPQCLVQPSEAEYKHLTCFFLRVARNMKQSADGRRQQGTIRMLLKNCLALLLKEKYPQVILAVTLFLFSFD
jgi:hypothetical protein